MVKVVTHKLTRKFLILSLLFGCFALLALPQRTHAELWGECDAAFQARMEICVNNWISCFLNGPEFGHTCEGDYSDCSYNAVTTHTNCLAGQPGPGDGGAGRARSACVRDCDDLYFDCADNGGVNTSTYNSCYTDSGGDVEVCCEVERSTCIVNNCGS
jgi:hypothetical protein